MNNERLETLLWERVDGTISKEDLAELEAHLAEHPQPREAEREISKLAEMLGEKDVLNPPAELREKINGALAAAKPPRSQDPPARTRVQTITTPPWKTRWLPLAASLVIGIAIGYLLSTGPASRIDPAQVSGTMTSPAWVPGPVFQIDLGGGSGLFKVVREAKTIIFELDLMAEVELEITVHTEDGRRIALGAHGPGAQRLVVDGEGGPMDLVVRKDGRIVAEHRIDPVSQSDQP